MQLTFHDADQCLPAPTENADGEKTTTSQEVLMLCNGSFYLARYDYERGAFVEGFSCIEGDIQWAHLYDKNDKPLT